MLFPSLKRSSQALVLVMAGGAAAGAACSSSNAPPGGGSGASGPNGTGASGGNGGQFFSGGGNGGGSIDIPPDMIDQAPPSTDSVIDECTGNVDQATLDTLRAGGGQPFGLLYPYDGTVWPRGLLAPILQWNQAGTADTVYLRLQSSDFTYEGCFGPVGAPHQLPIPQTPWTGAGDWSNGAGDPLMVTVTTMSGGAVTGTSTQQWTFALATIKGAIYYNTYTSPMAGNNGAVLKIIPGQAQPTGFLVETMFAPLIGPCFSCHSLSADGSTMTANRHNYTPGLASYESLSYDVTAQAPQLVQGGIPEAGFAGLYPDGTRAMTNGPPFASTSAFFPTAPGNVAALVGPAESHLIDVRTGQRIPAPGWDGEVLHAQMPMFSPDGRQIVYNDYDKGQGHSLWAADFDPATNTFSNKREIYNNPQAFPGWPFFTPDGQAVIFAAGTRPDFVSQLPNPITITPPDATGRSHLQIVYLSSPGQGTPLDLANGWRGGQSYLPAGAGRDNDLEFFPTVSPVAAGGYFWVFFTSRRTYGNIWTPDLEDPVSKKIWVSAISIGGQGGVDPSHPAFFLPGQEIESGNIRAFAALEPCKEDGSSCTSGTECCSGFCVNGTCQPPQMCAQLDDRCETAADCCDQTLRCIGGFCAQVILR